MLAMQGVPRQPCALVRATADVDGARACCGYTLLGMGSNAARTFNFQMRSGGRAQRRRGRYGRRTSPSYSLYGRKVEKKCASVTTGRLFPMQVWTLVPVPPTRQGQRQQWPWNGGWALSVRVNCSGTGSRDLSMPVHRKESNPGNTTSLLLVNAKKLRAGIAGNQQYLTLCPSTSTNALLP
eukprot:352249-Chlamydomonas_euryale.AAC.17